MRPEQRKYVIYRLDATLDWIARSDDWFKRSELGTRAMSTIAELGRTKDAFFEMDAEYWTSEYRNLRRYRDKLNEAIDEEDPVKRFDKIFEFSVWLHEIKLLHEDE